MGKGPPATSPLLPGLGQPRTERLLFPLDNRPAKPPHSAIFGQVPLSDPIKITAWVLWERYPCDIQSLGQSKALERPSTFLVAMGMAPPGNQLCATNSPVLGDNRALRGGFAGPQLGLAGQNLGTILGALVPASWRSSYRGNRGAIPKNKKRPRQLAPKAYLVGIESDLNRFRHAGFAPLPLTRFIFGGPA